MVGLRVSEDEETEGLDIVLHDEQGYNLVGTSPRVNGIAEAAMEFTKYGTRVAIHSKDFWGQHFCWL